jgi:iron complex transport system substrate-binding protein
VVVIILITVSIFYLTSPVESNNNLDGKVRIVDSTGAEIFVPKDLTRVGVVNTFTAEVMKALDVDMSVIVGVSGDFSYDTELWPILSTRPIIQDSAHGEPDMEAMLNQRIQLLITFGTHQFVDISSIRSKLEPAHISVVGIDLFKYEKLYNEIEILGIIFNRTNEADKLISEMKSVEDLVSNRLSDLSEENRAMVMIEHHASTPREPIVRASKSAWNILLEMAGGENIFKNEPGTTVHVDPEFIISSDPDFMFYDANLLPIGYGSFDQNELDTFIQSIKDRDGYGMLKAIIHDHIYLLSGEFNGPMMIHGMAVIATLLHPAEFADIDPDDLISDYYMLFHGIEQSETFYYPN